MPPRFFPPPQRSTPEGIVAIGGDLAIERLLDAYRHGIFPWPIAEGEPLFWWSPDPRAILPLNHFHASHRLLRRIRTGQYRVTFDSAFAEVIEQCASGPGREQGTWITTDMIAAYTQLHRLGHAHSVEAWYDSQLVGGVYGVAIGGAFAAESMFYRMRDASKVALYHLVAHLRAREFALLDVQQWTPHTCRLGAIEIPRTEYLAALATAVDLPVTW